MDAMHDGDEWRDPIQIRVHGIAGTEPRIILRTDPVEVDHSGLSSGVAVLEAPSKPPEGFSDLRAFSWTDLTSGRLVQGIQALLAPVLIVNVAGWMFPRFSNAYIDALVRACVRVAGLATTGALTIGVVWATYLTPGTACAALRTEVFRNEDLGDTRCRIVPADAPEWWFAVFTAALLVLAVVRLGRRPGAAREPVAGDDVRAFGLDWVERVSRAEGSSGLLRLLHAVFVLLVMATSWAVSRGFWLGRDTPTTSGRLDGSAANPLIWTLVLLLSLVMVAVSFVDRDPDAPDTRSRVLASATVVLFAGGTAFLYAPRFRAYEDLITGTLDQHFFLVNTIVVGFGAVPLLIVAVVSFADLFRTGSWYSLRAVGVLGLSMLISGAIAAGLAFLVVLALDLKTLRDVNGGNEHVAFALVLSLLFFVSWCLALMLRRGRSRVGSHPDERLAGIIREQLTAMTLGLVLAQIFGWVVGYLSSTLAGAAQLSVASSWQIVLLSIAVTAVLGVALVAGTFRHLVAPPKPTSEKARAQRQHELRKQVAIAAGLSLGAVIAAVLAFAWIPDYPSDLNFRVEIMGLVLPVAIIVYLVFRWLSDSESRRGLAALSDITTFWPRTFHPFAPHPYSGTAVGDLATAVETSRTEAPVLLAGHSQGSLIALLAVLQLDPDDEQRAPVALITYGSPIGQLYHRSFPAVFGDMDRIGRLVERRTRGWVNLHRPTDPIAAVIESSTVGFPDDRSTAEAPEDGHARYELTADFHDATDQLGAQLRGSHR